MEEGTIAKWHKKIGDKVASGELLVEVATDKATIEYNALDAGFLRKILIEEGGLAQVNQPIAVFTEKANENIEGYVPEGITPAQPAVKEEKPKAEAKPMAVGTAPSAPMQQPAFIPEPPLETYEFEFPTEAPALRARASPLAKKLAKERGLT